jgi:hypothetical protein
MFWIITWWSGKYYISDHVCVHPQSRNTRIVYRPIISLVRAYIIILGGQSYDSVSTLVPSSTFINSLASFRYLDGKGKVPMFPKLR